MHALGDTSPSNGPGIRSESELHVLLEHLPVAAYTCDAHGLITYINERAVELWGRRPKLNDAVDRYCGSFKLFSLDGSRIPHAECWMALALRNRRAYNNCEILIERPDGSRLASLAHANPFLDERGELVGAVNILVDITDRQRAAQVRAQLAAIVESSDDAIISKDLNGVIQSWNAAAQRLFGYTAEQAVGRHISFLIPPDRAEEEDLILARLRAGEQVYHFDTVRTRSDGQSVHVSLTISPVRDSTGRIIGASKIARDITDRKITEERLYNLMAQLKETDRRKDEFLAMLAHELRNPLAPLSNMLEIMKRGDGNGALLAQVRVTLERQLGQLVRLVDDLLDVSRVTRGKLELRKEPVEVAALLQQCVEASRSLIELARHQLEVSLPPEPLRLHADPVRLMQVFGNLLNNACKYTEPGGRIRLSAARQGSDLLVSVKDTGIGIPAEALARVFDLFTQIDCSRERAQGGLGIGLTLVKRLVEMHGGSVEACSAGRGQGSEFVVRLPLLNEKPERSRNGLAVEPALTTTHRILIVDDNQDAASSLSLLLSLTGNETKIAHDGLSAVDMAETFRPEVVLLDIGLPRLNGHDVCRRIRQQPWGQKMVLVALTGWGQDEDRRQSKEAGFDHHMVKPVDYAGLMELLASL